MATAQEAKFEEHQAQVYAWAYRLVQNHHDALDVSQEVFLRWWRARGDPSPPANPVGWLRRVTVNLAIDVVRAAARKPVCRILDEAVAVREPDPARAETARCVVDALQFLSERQRSVVVAKVYDGCTFAQIADQLGASIPTIKTHYLRALRGLRGKLAQRLGRDPSVRPRPEHMPPGDSRDRNESGS
ncbi:MAG: RNA polymerase sigma factor [Planctomycetota bacterium]|jgi:RNA polymerase sigma-70 factor (ECF subfamily)